MSEGGIQDLHAQIIDQMQRDRGWIVNSFAQIEFLLAGTIVRCREFPAYAELTETMPYRLDKRVDRFAEIVDADGPLSVERTALQKVIADFRGMEERRQFLVHGFCSFFHTPAGNTAMRFDRFMPSKEDDAAKKSMWFKPDILKGIREEVVASTAYALDTFRILHQEFGWQEAV